MRSRKLIGIALIAMSSLLATGCSLQGKAETQKTVVINEDVQLESSLADSSLAVSRKPDIEIGKNILNRPFYQGISSEKINFNKNGVLYSLDIKKGEEKKVADREAFTISEDGNWALSYENNYRELYIHNLQSGDMKLLENASPEDARFIGDEVAYADYNTSVLTLINPKTNERATWNLSRFKDFSISSMTKENSNVYIAVGSEKDGYGIHRLIENQEIETIFNLSGRDTQVSDFTMLQDGSVIFQGTYDGKDGIFYLDQKTKDVQQLVSGGEDDEGKWVPFYNLSPDKSKIMFGMPVQIEHDYKVNIYMAELVEGQLTNSTRIMENADLNAVISISGDWSKDSKTAYIKTAAKNKENVGNIAVFQVNE